MRHFVKITAIALTLALSSPLFAEDAKPFSDAKEVDLQMILPPPPANESATTKAELGVVLTLQVTRTQAQSDRAIADGEENIWRFSDVIDNPKFTAENLPKFAAFFDRVVATEGESGRSRKKVWMRPRPYLLSDLVKPLFDQSKSGSYPSGHATVGTLMGIVLSNMVPEKRAAIMSRAWEFGQNRVVAGMHYPSDIEAGRIAGSVIAQTISTHDDFKAEYEGAKTELRAALGM